jgi:hypothetical protein
MGIVGRIFVVLFGYWLACIAAAFVLTIGTVTPDWDYLASLGLHSEGVWWIVIMSSVIIGIIAMLPTLIVILLAEGFALRSIVLYPAFGGALALALVYGLDFGGYVGAPGSFLARERQVFAASGIAGGLVYWMFAGRTAGSWK